jgi:serine O-acetyltransferase
MDAVGLHRIAQRLHGWRVPLAPALLRRTIRFLFSTILPVEVQIGEGSALGYGGLGVVIHPEARIGARCLIGQHVTIGGRSGYKGAPWIGDEVLIAPGAKILGPIVVGDGAIVGANAVVLRSVGPGEVVGGIPAKPLRASQEAREAFREEMRTHFGVILHLENPPARADRG